MATELDVIANWVTDGYANNGIPRGRYEIPAKLSDGDAGGMINRCLACSKYQLKTCTLKRREIHLVPKRIAGNIILGGPYTRKIRVISIGAGITGILNSYQFQKNLKNIEHVVYEKNPDIGGTWLENRYPGCACDIPSHAYTYGFALNPDWPRFFSYAPDIWQYLNKVCEVWGLRKYMTFSTKVIGCYWQQETGEWLVKLEQTNPDGSKRQYEDRCHMLIQGTGVLNTPEWPNIKGIEKFKGRLIHTAMWPQDYQSEEWKKDRVAVIGSGASSIQTVPAMQPHVKRLDIFVRTGVWFIQIADNYGANHEYTDEQKAELRDPYKLVEHAKSIEDQVNSIWGIFYSKSKAQADAQEALKKRFASMVKDEKLIAGFTPKFGIGCRRVTPGDPYIEAIQKPNVNVHFTPVVEINETGAIGADGIHREVDTIVCATGFDVSYRPQFPLVGQSGIDLREKWKICPEGYLGLAVPGFPNFLIFTGPNWPVETGGIMGPLSYVSKYTQEMIRKLQTEYICSIAPKQGITDKFNEHCQEWMRHTVWTEDCRSWYKNNETGRVNAVWPGSSLHYMEAIKTPRWEDYEIEYLGPAKENPWAYLGMGTVPALVQKGDVSPYLNVEHLDPKWMEAAHIDAQKIYETRMAELQSKYEEQQKKSRNNIEKASVV